MTAPNYPSWSDLENHAQGSKSLKIKDLFDSDKNRVRHFEAEAAGIYLDYSKNIVSKETMELFAKISEEAGLSNAIESMFKGEKVNATEDRAALHTLLRSPQDEVNQALKTETTLVAKTLNKMRLMSEGIITGDISGCRGDRFTDIVHLGIGGSNLGPYMVDEALAAQRGLNHKDINCHYVANIDGHHITQVLDKINPITTLILIASKSFSTLETHINAETAKKWLLTNLDEDELKNHLIAMTSNQESAMTFGVAENNILDMWDWVGGRYSLWSSVGLPIAIRYGFDTFAELLSGAAEMDQHFRRSKMQNNLPMILAWLGIWYTHFFDAESHAVIAYDHGLRFLPAHLQQLDMESNGKSVAINGDRISYPTGPIIWGGEGSNGQHAYHQLLHQGTRFVSIDFILPLTPHHNEQEHHDQLVANCFSQSQALLEGEHSDVDSIEGKHKSMPGNRPSNTLLVDKLTAKTLGALIAMYEHKVFCQATIWKINPFDQWGVELGKKLGTEIYNKISKQSNQSDQAIDASTSSLINRYLNKRL